MTAATVERIELRRACRCGDVLTVHATGVLVPNVEALATAWDAEHAGPGHNTASRTAAGRVRHRSSLVNGALARMILDLLADRGELTATDIALELDRAWSTIQNAMRALRDAGRVTVRPQERTERRGGRPAQLYRVAR